MRAAAAAVRTRIKFSKAVYTLVNYNYVYNSTVQPAVQVHQKLPTERYGTRYMNVQLYGYYMLHFYTTRAHVPGLHVNYTCVCYMYHVCMYVTRNKIIK